MAKKLIKNAYAIVTCDANDNVFYESDLLIDGPAIVKIGKNIEAEDAEVIHASDKIIYPGLINTHHHFFQFSLYSNIDDQMHTYNHVLINLP